MHTLKRSFLFTFNSSKHELMELEAELHQALNQLTALATPRDISQNLLNFPYPSNGRYVAILPEVAQTLCHRNRVFMPSLMTFSHDSAQFYRSSYNTVVETLNEHALLYESECNRWKSTLAAKEAVVVAESNKLGIKKK